MELSPNRVAVILTAGAALLSALAPIVADLDITNTVQILGSLAAAVTVVHKWLDGWQQYEHRSYYGVPMPEEAGDPEQPVKVIGFTADPDTPIAFTPEGTI